MAEIRDELQSKPNKDEVWAQFSEIRENIGEENRRKLEAVNREIEDAQNKIRDQVRISAEQDAKMKKMTNYYSVKLG